MVWGRKKDDAWVTSFLSQIFFALTGSLFTGYFFPILGTVNICFGQMNFGSFGLTLDISAEPKLPKYEPWLDKSHFRVLDLIQESWYVGYSLYTPLLTTAIYSFTCNLSHLTNEGSSSPSSCMYQNLGPRSDWVY